MSKDLLKNHGKTLFYSKKLVKYTGDVDKRPKNSANANNRTEKNITKRLQKFTNTISTKEIYRISLRYSCGIGKVNHLIKIDLKTTCMFETDMNKLFESNRQLNSIVAFHDVAFIQYNNGLRKIFENGHTKNPTDSSIGLKKQSGGWLDRYDSTYACRDAVNTGYPTFNRMAPALINKTSNKIDRISKKRIQQVVQQEGKKIEWIAPKIIKNGM